MWPDIFSVNGVPNCDLKEIDSLGYRFVTMHLFEKALMYGMMKYGMENRKNGNPVFSETHDFEGIADKSKLSDMVGNYSKWFRLAEDCRNF